jgi:NTP pyrophosphatase (non-canonical NTP hydrolase)
MELDYYQTQAENSRLPTVDLEYLLMGFIGEVGEVYSLLAKNIRDETDFEPEKIKKELGDCLWFLATICNDFGLSLDDVAKANLEKLLSRKIRGTLQGSGDDR